ncbi:TetR/AcrR family transcriptional regulator [Streptomyces sp. MS19]|uniref:TetR/AcrR family transcriptional regulator n=1 Tax=Streptomyces sp. MS19 TaxID=3385972 RepID=UPI00399F6363
MTPSASPPRRMRADARRNRERLLAEAREVFEEQGAQASLELVARRAGVAIGTLYGHFPTRGALLEALLRDRQEAVHELGDTLAADPEPGAALARWMRAVTAHGAVYSGLAGQYLGSLEDTASELHAACTRMSAAGELLVARARSAGAVRQDVTAQDVFALISAAAWLRDQLPAEQADRQLNFMIDGLGVAAGP